MTTGDPPCFLDLVGPVSPPCDVAFEADVVKRRALSGVSFKYDEHVYIDEVKCHVAETYGSHYASPNGVQALDLIFSTGGGMGFCLGNALKYAARFGKKNGRNRGDLLKVIHYALLALYLLDNEREKPKEK